MVVATPLSILALLAFTLHSQFSFAKDQFFPGKNKAKHLVVFVHGLGGDAVKTWTKLKSNGEFYWPKALSEDEENGPYDTYSFEYRADCDNVLPNEASGQLYLRIQDLMKQNNYAKISFIGHSLGGIVIRDLILHHLKDLKASVKIFLLGTPNLGNWRAIAKTLLCGGKYLDSLTVGRNSYLDKVNEDWRGVFEQRSSKKDFDFYAGYEVVPLILDVVVEKASAVLFSQKIASFDENHFDLAKPSDRSSLTYRWFIQNATDNPSPRAENGISESYEKRLVAFFDKAREKLSKPDFEKLVIAFNSDARETSLPADNELAMLYIAAKMEKSGNFGEAFEAYMKLASKKSNVPYYSMAAFELSAAYAAKNRVSINEVMSKINSAKIAEPQKAFLTNKIENQKHEWKQFLESYQNSINAKAAASHRATGTGNTP